MLQLSRLDIALGTRANLPQMIKRINPRAVSIVPVNPYRIRPYLLHRIHLQRGLIHLKRIRRRRIIRFLRLRSMRPGAGRARAFIAQISQRIIAVVVVSPINLDSVGFRNRYMFWICRYGHFKLITALHSFNVADARNASKCVDDAFQLFLIANINSNVDHGAVVGAVLIAARF